MMSKTFTRNQSRFYGVTIATLTIIALGIGAVQLEELPIQSASVKDAIITTNDGKNVTEKKLK